MTVGRARCGTSGLASARGKTFLSAGSDSNAASAETRRSARAPKGQDFAWHRASRQQAPRTGSRLKPYRAGGNPDATGLEILMPWDQRPKGGGGGGKTPATCTLKPKIDTPGDATCMSTDAGRREPEAASSDGMLTLLSPSTLETRVRPVASRATCSLSVIVVDAGWPDTCAATEAPKCISQLPIQRRAAELDIASVCRCWSARAPAVNQEAWTHSRMEKGCDERAQSNGHR